MKKKLQPCPDCAQLISVAATACPHCGKKLRLSDAARVIIALVVIAIFVGIAAAIYNAGNKAEKLHDEIEAIHRANQQNPAYEHR